MPNVSFDFTTLSVFMVLHLAIYSVIILIFTNARKKYKGGIVAKVIQFMIATLGFFLLSDMALFMIPMSGFQLGYSLHLILKICAMTCLAVAGLKFLVR